VANAPTRLGALLDTIFQIKPTVMVILAQITPTRLDAVNARITPYNAAMSGLVQQRLATGRHIQLVDMNGAFTAFADYRTSQLADDLHPNPTGYSTMAGVWYTALAPLLN
jgi:lysophospholipase L1-like esterase